LPDQPPPEFDRFTVAYWTINAVLLAGSLTSLGLIWLVLAE
jgi:hypothetical protein